MEVDDSFWKCYKKIHQRWEEEHSKNERMSKDLLKSKTKLKDAKEEIEILRERCDAAEKALSEIGYVMNSDAQEAKYCMKERLSMFEDMLELEKEVDKERALHENVVFEMEKASDLLEQEIDGLRNDLENSISQRAALESKSKLLAEENIKLNDTLNALGYNSLASVTDSYDKLMRTFLSMFPQSESENEWQFHDQRTKKSTPSFHLLVLICYEDLIGNVNGMDQILKQASEMVEVAQKYNLTAQLSRYMRTLQWINAGLFTDIQEAIDKQSELTRHKILYENKELVSARQAFAVPLMKAITSTEKK